MVRDARRIAVVFGLLLAGAAAQSRPATVAEAAGSRPAAGTVAPRPAGVYRPLVRVIDAAERPVRNATVFAGDPDFDGGFAAKAVWFPAFTTDDEGRVAIPTGAGVAIQAEAPGFETGGGFFTIADDAGEDLVLRLVPQVVAPKGEPPRDERERAGPGPAPATAPAPRGGNRLQVLDPRGRIASDAIVRISPLVGSAAVVARSAFIAANRAAESARTNEAGEFHIRNPRPGSIGIAVRLPGVGVAARAAPVADSGGRVVIRLSPERRVTVRAVDGGGRPASGVLIAATDADGVVYPAGPDGDVFVPDDETPSFVHAATESVSVHEPIPRGATEVRVILPTTGRARVSSYVPLYALRPGRPYAVDEAIRGVVSDSEFPHLQAFTLPPGVWRFVPLPQIEAESRFAARFPFIAEHRRLGFSAAVVPGADLVVP